MPVYQFRTADGQDTELEMTMAEAPEIGSTIWVDGQELTRLPPVLAGRGVDEAHIGHSLPPWDPHAPRHTKNGKPVFLGKRERVEYQAKTGRSWNAD